MSTITLRNTKGSALTFTEMDNNFSNLNTDKLEAVVSDTTPQLGGNLDVNTNAIVSASNNDIQITPDGSGAIVLDGLYWPTADGTSNQVLKTDGLGNLSWTDASAGGATQLNELSDVNPSLSPSDGQVLVYNTSNGYFQAETKTFATGSELSNVVEDTTPQLGGTLDGQANTVQDVKLENYKETVYTGGATTGTITPDVANGNVQSITLTGNITFNAFANAEAGQSMTLIIKQSATGGETLTSSMLFADGSNTLSATANAIDIMTVFYDGTTYYASLAVNFS